MKKHRTIKKEALFLEAPLNQNLIFSDEKKQISNEISLAKKSDNFSSNSSTCNQLDKKMKTKNEQFSIVQNLLEISDEKTLDNNRIKPFRNNQNFNSTSFLLSPQKDDFSEIESVTSCGTFSSLDLEDSILLNDTKKMTNNHSTEELKDTLLKVEQSFKLSKADISILVTEKEQLQLKLHESLNENKNLENQLKISEKEKSQMKFNLSTNQKHFQLEKNKLQFKICEFEKEVELKQNKLEDLIKEIEELKLENLKTKDDKISLESHLEMLQIQKTELSSEVSSFSDLNMSLKSLLQQTTEDNLDRKDYITSLRADRDEYASQLYKSNQEILAQQISIKHLQDRLSESQKNYFLLKNQNNQLTKNLELKNNETERLVSQLRVKVDEKEDLDEVVRRLNEDIKNVEAGFQNIKEEINLKKSLADQREIRRLKMEDQIIKFEKEVNKLTSDVKHRDEMIHDKNNQIDQMLKQAENLSNSKDTIFHQLEESKSQLFKTQIQYESLTKRNLELQEKNSEKEKELTNLKMEFEKINEVSFHNDKIESEKSSNEVKNLFEKKDFEIEDKKSNFHIRPSYQLEAGETNFVKSHQVSSDFEMKNLKEEKMKLQNLLDVKEKKLKEIKKEFYEKELLLNEMLLKAEMENKNSLKSFNDEMIKMRTSFDLEDQKKDQLLEDCHQEISHLKSEIRSSYHQLKELRLLIGSSKSCNEKSEDSKTETEKLNEVICQQQLYIRSLHSHYQKSGFVSLVENKQNSIVEMKLNQQITTNEKKSDNLENNLSLTRFDEKTSSNDSQMSEIVKDQLSNLPFNKDIISKININFYRKLKAYKKIVKILRRKLQDQEDFLKDTGSHLQKQLQEATNLHKNEIEKLRRRRLLERAQLTKKIRENENKSEDLLKINADLKKDFNKIQLKLLDKKKQIEIIQREKLRYQQRSRTLHANLKSLAVMTSSSAPHDVTDSEENSLKLNDSVESITKILETLQ